MHVWVAGKTDPSLTRAIPEHLRDESLITKRYTKSTITVTSILEISWNALISEIGGQNSDTGGWCCSQKANNQCSCTFVVCKSSSQVELPRASCTRSGDHRVRIGMLIARILVRPVQRTHMQRTMPKPVHPRTLAECAESLATVTSSTLAAVTVVSPAAKLSGLHVTSYDSDFAVFHFLL